MANLHKNPLVSIIIPCYNKEDLVVATIDSVMRSTYPNYEIIIVNDGSNNKKTVGALKNIEKNYPEIKVINQKNQGVSVARNRGIDESKGEYILLLDNDDLIDSLFLEKSVNFLERNKKIDFVFPELIFFGDMCGIGLEEKFSPKRLRFSSYIPITCLHRKNNFKQIRFNAKPGMLEDLDFLIKLAKEKKVGVGLSGLYFFYRVSVKGRNSLKESYLSRRQKINDIFKANNMDFPITTAIINLVLEVLSFFTRYFRQKNEKNRLKHKLKYDSYFQNEVKTLKINFNQYA